MHMHTHENGLVGILWHFLSLERLRGVLAAAAGILWRLFVEAVHFLLHLEKCWCFASRCYYSAGIETFFKWLPWFSGYFVGKQAERKPI